MLGVVEAVAQHGGLDSGFSELDRLCYTTGMTSGSALRLKWRLCCLLHMLSVATSQLAVRLSQQRSPQTASPPLLRARAALAPMCVCVR